MENMQKTGAFKIRGASYKLALLSGQETEKGIIAASAGNHAQGVALAASKRGIPVKIFMPENTPLAKIAATRNYGAAVVLSGNNYDEAYEAALTEQKTTKSTFVHPFDDYDVMAGQSTIAVEMLEQQPLIDTLIVPVGGGGLIGGIAVAAKLVKPNIRVIGVQAKGACSMFNHFYQTSVGKQTEVNTIAEGIAVRKPGTLTSSIIHQYVDEMLTVSDHEIAAAMVYMLERKKMLLEGAGAAAFAALLTHGRNILSQHCGVIVSGGNLDISKIAQIQHLARQNFLSYLA
ncbi:threonine dehydratase [Bacillus sp. UNCCL13]|nr:threonine dehydratase [Bacillus sp. UNCCL13]